MRKLIIMLYILILGVFTAAQSPNVTQNLVASDGSYTVDVPSELEVTQLGTIFVVSDTPFFELNNDIKMDWSTYDGFVMIISNRSIVLSTANQNLSFEELSGIATSSFMSSVSDTFDFGETTFTKSTEERQLATTEIINEDQVNGIVYFWSYGNEDYLLQVVMGNDNARMEYSEVIDAITDSVSFEEGEYLPNIETELIWSVPIETSLYYRVVSRQDQIYVATHRREFAVYSVEGKFLYTIDVQAEDYDGGLIDFAVSEDGSIWIADVLKQQLIHIASDGDLLHSMTFDNQPMNRPNFVGIDSYGNVYTNLVVDDKDHIVTFDDVGQYIRDFPIGDDVQTIGRNIEILNDEIYVSTLLADELDIYTATGDMIENQLSANVGLLSNQDRFFPLSDNLFLATGDYEKDLRVFVFDGNGNHIYEFSVFDAILQSGTLEALESNCLFSASTFAYLETGQIVILNPCGNGILYP